MQSLRRHQASGLASVAQPLLARRFLCASAILKTVDIPERSTPASKSAGTTRAASPSYLPSKGENLTHSGEANLLALASHIIALSYCTGMWFILISPPSCRGQSSFQSPLWRVILQCLQEHADSEALICANTQTKLSSDDAQSIRRENARITTAGRNERTLRIVAFTLVDFESIASRNVIHGLANHLGKQTAKLPFSLSTSVSVCYNNATRL
jgi:hypothetical protein